MKKLLFIAIFFVLAVPAYADEASIGGTGTTVQVMDNEDIQMVDEIINIDVFESAKQSDFGMIERGHVDYEVIYNFKNTSDQQVTVTMGFPEKCDWLCLQGDEGQELSKEGTIWESGKLFDFAVLDGNDAVDVEFKNENEAETEYTNWYISEISFAPGEEKTITNTYWTMPWAYKSGYWFDYTLETGASWKDKIEKVDIYVNFHDDLEFYNVDDISPAGYSFNLETGALEWHLNNIEPVASDDLYVHYVPNDFYNFGCSVAGDEMISGEYGSSFLVSDELGDGVTLDYYPCKASDGDIETSWVEGVTGSGVGQWVKVWMDTEKTYYSMDIFAGYGGNEDVWGKNNRIKKMKVTFSNGVNFESDLDDVFAFQKVDLDEAISGVEYATIEILEVYEGSKFDDTALAEVRFNGLLNEGLSAGGLWLEAFSDVPVSHANFDAILKLKSDGVIDGYTDGTFRPDGLINRAELMKMVVEMVVGDPNDLGVFENCFSDVKDDWYAPYVCYGENNGWVDGYADGTFKPSKNVNRAEAIKIVLNAFYDGEVPEFVMDIEEYGIFYEPNDVGRGEWYYPFLMRAVDSKLLDLTHVEADAEGWWYFPGEDMTRKEVAEMIYRLEE